MRIACHAGSSLGGAQKAAWLYAKYLSQRGHEVRVLTTPGKIRSNYENLSVEVVEVARKADWVAFYASGWAEGVHHHAPGYFVPSTFYDVLEELPEKTFRVVETNVFGCLVNPQADRHVDFRLFISMANGAQAFRRSRIADPTELLSNHTALYYPVEKINPLSTEERSSFRKSLGVSDEKILVIRLGRPDPRKWCDWECKAFEIARRKNPQLVFLQIEPPAALDRKIQRGDFGPGFVVHSLVSSQDWLSRLYRSSDIMLHASLFGESFGYTIAEGMSAGIPVVTGPLPWGDNAQVELVKHAETGFVCDSIAGLGAATQLLSTDESLRLRMGRAGKLRIESLADPEYETRILEEIFLDPSNGSLLRQRKEAFSQFIHRFSELEKNVLERSHTELGSFPMLKNSLETGYRTTRAHVRRFKASLKTRLGLPAYR